MIQSIPIAFKNVLLREKAFFIALVSGLVLFFFGHTLLTESVPGGLLALVFTWLCLVIIAAALGVVHHAEALAHRFGEPYGTLILTISAVCIEVIMIVAMMLHTDPDPTMARDTIYSTLMIIINGQIGLAMLLGGIKWKEQAFNLKSSNAFFSMLIVFAGLGLALPNFISPASLRNYDLFLILMTFSLYLVFLRVQTKEHRCFFTREKASNKEAMTVPHTTLHGGMYHTGFLFATLFGVAYLAESLAVTIDVGVARLNLPGEAAAFLVATLILLPEGLAAIRAGLDNEMQRVVNISLGSALSTLGLTIPTVLIVGLLTHREVVLGLAAPQGLLLGLTLLIGMNSYKSGETNALQGAIHFFLFIAFTVLIFL